MQQRITNTSYFSHMASKQSAQLYVIFQMKKKVKNLQQNHHKLFTKSLF